MTKITHSEVDSDRAKDFLARAGYIVGVLTGDGIDVVGRRLVYKEAESLAEEAARHRPLDVITILKPCGVAAAKLEPPGKE